MTSLMDDNEIIKQIEEYPDHNYIWIEIWQKDVYKIELVVTINNEEMIKFHHKVLIVSSLSTEEESSEVIKTRGREIKKMLKKHFKNSEIHSNLRYR